jgi:transposase
MLSGALKLLVSMEHWTAAHSVFAVESYFKNMVKTRRLFRRHFNIHRNARVASKNTIKLWVKNFRQTASVMKKRPSGRPRTVRTPENVDRVGAAVLQRRSTSVRVSAIA